MVEVDGVDLASAARVLLHAPVRGRSGERMVRAGQHVVVIADKKSLDVANAIVGAIDAGGATGDVMNLDELKSTASNHTGERPHKLLPTQLRRGMLRAHASIFVASAPIQERPMREQLFGIIDTCAVRHAHLPDITKHAFVCGMRVDYDTVVSTGRAMALRLEFARAIETESDAGTNLKLSFSPESRWIPRLGELVPGKSVTFPAGAVFASPEDVHGVFVANASVGEFFGAREGLLAGKPVVLTIEQGRVIKVQADSTELQGNIEAMLRFSANSDRVGLVAVGVNTGIGAATGESIVDQNLLGLHLFIGDPASKATGATWSARTSFAVCQDGGKVLIDGRVAIASGKIAGAS
jgi:leucyl aminopeptidase (aminopeptidase T)